MAWGDSWGESPGRNALALAKAFKEERKLALGKARVEVGERYVTYYYAGGRIARKVRSDKRAQQVADILVGKVWVLEEGFSCGGYPDKAVARHLRALGVDAKWQYGKRPFLINGVDVSSGEWFTLDELARMPKWKEPARPPRRERFVNLTLPLFA